MPYPSRPLTPPWSQTPPAVPAFLQPAPLRTPLLTIHHPLCSRRSSKVPLPRIAGRAHPTVSQLDGVKAPSANADAQQQSPSATARTTFGFSHPDFVHAVEGEWFGYECAFSTPDGALVNIPDHFVPDEFREWGVEIPGFDSLSSSKCLEDGLLFMKRTRALPSVGCEADAVVPDVAERTFPTSDEHTINGGFPDGTISCGPAQYEQDSGAAFSIALAHPVAKTRVRLDFKSVKSPTGSLTMLMEKWDADFCGGSILPGCGGASERFAENAVLETSKALSGTWDVESVVFTFGSGDAVPQHYSCVIERMASSVLEEVTIALPNGVSVGVQTDEGGVSTVTAGWLVLDGERVVTQRIYGADGELKTVSRALERKRN